MRMTARTIEWAIRDWISISWVNWKFPVIFMAVQAAGVIGCWIEVIATR